MTSSCNVDFYVLFTLQEKGNNKTITRSK